MVLGRHFDQRMLDLQRQGRIGTFPPITGQEASQIGAIAALKASDWFVPSFRETAAEIWHGRSLESILLYYNGFNEGTIVPENCNILPMAVPVASQILHGVGLGWAARYRNDDSIVLTCFGDGATSQGDFHEGLNCAAVFAAPVVFFCQNNQWAISVPLKLQTHSRTIAQKAIAYGIPGIQVDGNDVLAVYVATYEAVQRARSGNGPTLIESVTYRLMMHTTADDPKRYRDDAEVEFWQKRDPLPRYEIYLKNKGLLPDSLRTTIIDDVAELIQQSIDSAEKQMKHELDPEQMFDHLFEQLPPHLQKQREEFRFVQKHSGEKFRNG